MQFSGCLKDTLILWDKHLNIIFQKVPIERLFSVRRLKEDLHLERIHLVLKPPHMPILCFKKTQEENPIYDKPSGDVPSENRYWKLSLIQFTGV